jgi:O-glycosyl hydrolase
MWSDLLDAVGYERTVRSDCYTCQCGVIQSDAGDRKLVVINHAAGPCTTTVQAGGRTYELALPAKGVTAIAL